MNSFRIPFNKPSLSGNELFHVAESIRAGHISSDGDSQSDAGKCWKQSLLFRGSVNDFLHPCARNGRAAPEHRPGDEVIVPSFTFVSTVNAFVLRGAVPKFVDIRSDTLNMDESRIEPLITSRTKAIVPVHYAGVGCEMDTIISLAKSIGSQS